MIPRGLETLLGIIVWAQYECRGHVVIPRGV